MKIASLQLKNEDASIQNGGGRVSINATLRRTRQGGGPTVMRTFTEIRGVTVDRSGSSLRVSGCDPSGASQAMVLVANGGRDQSQPFRITTPDVYHEIVELRFNKRPSPAQIIASVQVAADYSDQWYNVLLTKQIGDDGTERTIGSWDNGTGQRGAAASSSGFFVDQEADIGIVIYRIHIKRHGVNNPEPGDHFIQIGATKIIVLQP